MIPVQHQYQLSYHAYEDGDVLEFGTTRQDVACVSMYQDELEVLECRYVDLEVYVSVHMLGIHGYQMHSTWVGYEFRS